MPKINLRKFAKIWLNFTKFSKMLANFWQNIEIAELCKVVHCVDLGESFQTHISLQNLASIQPRTSPLKFAASDGSGVGGGSSVVRVVRDLPVLSSFARKLLFEKLSGVRKLTAFYLAKNDHRWVTFISLKTINSAGFGRSSECLEKRVGARDFTQRVCLWKTDNRLVTIIWANA